MYCFIGCDILLRVVAPDKALWTSPRPRPPSSLGGRPGSARTWQCRRGGQPHYDYNPDLECRIDYGNDPDLESRSSVNIQMQNSDQI